MVRCYTLSSHVSTWTRAFCLIRTRMCGQFDVDCCTCWASGFYFTLETSHPPRAETWLVCHVALWLKLITRMHGIQSEASEGCHGETGRISNASSEIQWTSQTLCTQLTYCKCQYKFERITAPYVSPLELAKVAGFFFCWWSSPFDQETRCRTIMWLSRYDSMRWRGTWVSWKTNATLS